MFFLPYVVIFVAANNFTYDIESGLPLYTLEGGCDLIDQF